MILFYGNNVKKWKASRTIACFATVETYNTHINFIECFAGVIVVVVVVVVDAVGDRRLFYEKLLSFHSTQTHCLFMRQNQTEEEIYKLIAKGIGKNHFYHERDEAVSGGLVLRD